MIIGALLGLAGSIIPEIFKLYKEKKDREYEIEMFKLQMQNAELLAKLEMEKAKIVSSLEVDKALYEYAKPVIVPTGFKFADILQAVGYFLNTIIRPAVTVIAITIWGFNADKIPFDLQIDLFSCIITFWFGGRAFTRTFERNVYK